MDPLEDPAASVEPGATEERRRAVQMAALRVKYALDSGEYRQPILPEVAVRLAQMAAKLDADIPTVEKTVGSDPAVAARVLSRANSAAMSRGVTITSLRNAVTRLGLTEVRDIAFEIVARTQLFTVPRYEPRMRELLGAARTSGALAKRICKELKLSADLAFLCGLLHDLGEAIILSVCAEQEKLLGTSRLPSELTKELVAHYHEQVGLLACNVWNLPESICDAVAHHHHPEQSQSPARMAHVVAVTDRLVEHVGLGGAPANPSEPGAELVIDSLHLSAPEVQRLVVAAESLAKDGDKDEG